MIETKVAHRYAKSLLGLAIERKIQDKVFEDMKLIAEACKNNPDLALVFRSPIINTDKKDAIIKAVFQDKIDPVTSAFLSIITRKRREYYLEQIAAAFIAIYKTNKGISIAHITTASPIDEKIRIEIMKLMNLNSNKTVELVEHVKKDLIGGFVLRYGDEQVDASVARKIKSLRKDFKANLYVKEY